MSIIGKSKFINKQKNFIYDLTDKEESVSNYVEDMLMRTNSMFKWSGLPENITSEEMELMLQVNGYVIVTYVKQDEIHNNKYKEGIYLFSTGCSLGGELNYLYKPTLAIINNPAMGLSIQRKIDVDCTIIRNDILLKGLVELNKKYATMLTENNITLYIYDILTRSTALISAPNGKVAQSAKMMLEDIQKGKLGVITDNPLLDENGGVKSLPFQGNSDKFNGLIEYHQYLKASWLNELGLNANFNMKREALNSNETGVNVSALLPFIDHMRAIREQDIKKTNNLFNTKFSIELESSWKDIQEEANEKEEVKEEIEEDTREDEKPI